MNTSEEERGDEGSEIDRPDGETNNSAGTEAGAEAEAGADTGSGTEATTPENAAEAAEDEEEDKSPPVEAQGSAVQIAENPFDDEEEDDLAMELGDRWEIKSPKYGGSVVGILYYLDAENLIRILPDGVSNKVYDFKIIDGGFDPELNITEPPERYNKGQRLDSGESLGFTDLMNFEVGQKVLTFKEDGTQGPELTVKAINSDQDSIKVEDSTGAERDITFGRIGIPLSEEFVVIQKVLEEGEDTPLTPEQVAAEEAARQLALTQGAESALALGEEIDETEDIGTLEMDDIILIQEIGAADVIYPELSQKSDLLADLVGILDEPSQQNPLLLKRIRALVEMASSLKNSIIKRAEDGRPIGEVEKISLSTMADVVSNTGVPIARPVLKTQRVVVYEKPGGNMAEDTDQFSIRDFFDLVEKSNEYLNDLAEIPLPAEGSVGIPRWFQAIYSYFQKYPIGDKYSSGVDYKFSQDGEYFRTGPPESETTKVLEKLFQYDPEEGKFIDMHSGVINDGLFVNGSQSLRRGHGPTMRPLDKGGVEIGIPADKATLDGHVLFPYKAVQVGAIGATRTGQLLQDMYRSSSVKTWMTQLVEELGGVTKGKDANSIMYVPKYDADAVGISFSEYLQYVLAAIVPRGPGDLAGLKRDIGISDSEPNLEQQNVIKERVQEIIKSLIARINNIREETEKEPSKPGIQSVFEGDFIQRVQELIGQGRHEMLEQLLKDMGSRTPGYRQVDVAVTATMMLYAQDYFLAVLGGQLKAIERERIRASRGRLLKALQDSLALDRLKKEAGRPPERNPCAHVAALLQVRKIPDDAERMGLLTKFIAKFRGERKDNWEMCAVCKKELICHHEVLQVQQFLHPMEHATIQKEIILNYAGGTFGAKHICRNCGLAVAELDFEKNIEYDDDGRPMMGRSVLVDTDAAEKEAMELLFGARIEKDEEINFQDSTKNEFYKIARVIVDYMGLQFDGVAYRKLVDRAAAGKLKYFTKERAYSDQRKANPKIPDYDKYLSMVKVAMTAVLVLLEVQTHRPNYIIRFSVPGCRPGFDGFPLNREADPDNPDQSVGIHYMICALTGIIRNEAPWSTGFLKYAQTETRKKMITSYVLQFIKAMAPDVEIQEELDRKRVYLRETLGDGTEKGRPDEVIPAGFLPQMLTPAESAEVAANAPVVAEGVSRGELGDILQSDAWIRAVNTLAKRNALIVKGSPFAETACCFDPITTPGSFWRNAELPPIPRLYGLAASFVRQSIFYVPIHPARPLAFTATAPLSKAYLVFFKICWQGPRVGLAHEIGYDHKCDWCGIELPTQYLYPDAEYVPKNEKEEAALQARLAQRENEIRSLFDAQGIPVTEQSFQALLDAAHRRTEFRSYVPPPTPTSEEIVENLFTIEPAPIKSWSERIKDVQANLKGLPATASVVEIAKAFEPLGNEIDKADNEIKTRLPPDEYNNLVSILKLPQPHSIFEIVRSYFLIPSQRLLQRYESKRQQSIRKDHFKLSVEHEKELNTMLENHCSYMADYKGLLHADIQTGNKDKKEEEKEGKKEEEEEEEEEDITKKLNGKALLKLYTFVEQLRQMLEQANELRVSRIKYDSSLPSNLAQKFLKEIIHALIFGPLSDLLNANVPAMIEGIEYEGNEGQSHAILRGFITKMIKQYRNEALSYDPDKVRRMIEDSKEAEKQRFISDLDNLSEEERRIELQKKRLGIGRWAIGGTKLVWQYDPDQWDKNREDLRKNYDALAGMGRDGPAEPTGPEYDGIGLTRRDGGGEGYDIAVTGAFAEDD